MFIVIVKEMAYSNIQIYSHLTFNYGEFSTIEECDEFVDKMIKIKIKKHKRELAVYKIKPKKPVIQKGMCKGKNVAMLLLTSKRQENKDHTKEWIDRVVITFRRVTARLIERK